MDNGWDTGERAIRMYEWLCLGLVGEMSMK